MRFRLSKFVVFLILGFSGLCTGQAQFARTTLSAISVTQCSGHKTSYQLFLSARFVIENTSQSPLLISRRIEVIPLLRAASSEENARKKVFLFTRQDEYGGPSPNLPIPDLSAFQIVSPGDKATFLFDPPIELFPGTQPHGLSPGGTYWLQFGFYTFPEYFYWESQELLRFKKTWSSVAQIREGLIWTEPFRFVVEHRDPQAPSCE
jgi:hypothetical protein